MFPIYKVHPICGVKDSSQKGHFKIAVCGNTVKIPVTDRKRLICVAFRNRTFFDVTSWSDYSETMSPLSQTIVRKSQIG